MGGSIAPRTSGASVMGARAVAEAWEVVFMVQEEGHEARPGGRSQGSGLPGAKHVQPRQRASAGQVLADVASRSQGLGFGLSGVGHILQRQRPGLQGLVPVKNCPKLHEIHESGYRPRSIR